MPEIYVRHNPAGGCDACGRTTDQMWQSSITMFFYCDDCRRRNPADELVRVV